MSKVVEDILEKVAGISGPTEGAYSIRVNGVSVGKGSTEGIEIRPKEDGNGLDIIVQPGIKREHVHMPVVIDKPGHSETVLNDFYIGEGADITIVAGCGIHNGGGEASRHDGIHTFHLEKNARVAYVEKHYGEGKGSGTRILNPVTRVYLAPGSFMEMDTVQIEGVDSTKRRTVAVLEGDSTLIVKEKLMTSGSQWAETVFEVELNGAGSSTDIVSRSVARDESRQEFLSVINGNNRCMGHSECDAIIMGNAVVKAVPEITANHVDASLIHEAAIGKIAGEQIIKLMTLGLTEEEAEAQIVNGFLK